MRAWWMFSHGLIDVDWIVWSLWTVFFLPLVNQSIMDNRVSDPCCKGARRLSLRIERRGNIGCPEAQVRSYDTVRFSGHARAVLYVSLRFSCRNEAR